jgi:hypothetical protein
MGLVFGAAWAVLLWMRWDVAKRMAEGRLPSQQPAEPAEPARSTESTESTED